MRELGREESQKGANVQLAIDTKLQNFTQARLDGESAAAVVMDVTNGDLLAIGSAPAFDPNLFVRGISVKDYSGPAAAATRSSPAASSTAGNAAGTGA